MGEQRLGNLPRLITTILFFLSLSASPGFAQSLAEAACYIFEGKLNCLKIKVTNPETCEVKLYPREIKSHDPEIAGCLIDDLQTQTVSFKKLTEISLVIKSSSAGREDKIAHLILAGEEAISVLSSYNEHGGPEWTPVNRIRIPIKGDIPETKRMLQLVQQNLCSIRTNIARSDYSGLKEQLHSDKYHILSAEEAHRRSAQGQLILIDIRRPSEWRMTGIAPHAVPISMHQNPNVFLKKLKRVADRTGENHWP